MIELIDRATVQLAHRDEFIAGLHDRMEGEHLRRMAGSNCECRGAALERCNLRFQDRLRRIHDPRVDVSESTQSKQVSRVLDVIKDIGSRLIYRRNACTRRWIGLSAGMKRQCVE